MVGGPFSGDSPEACEQNIVATEMLGIEVAGVGGAPIVPNSMGRSVMKVMAENYVGSPGYEVWIEITLSILARSDAFIVTKNWEKSSGTRREIEAAFFFGVPVFYDIPSLKRWMDAPLVPMSPVIKRRLRSIKAALDLPDPVALADCMAQVPVLREGILAYQSMDDLGLEANQKLLSFEKILMDKYTLRQEGSLL